ncbi:ABC transporter ATP-binding protein [Murimonas intestini]|uniref:ATP-binding cassette subfamily B protein n=1 Tax=Murimonas intestini TaxID=1337051 RepID=A0AB73T7V8_9FIRM|nr:ABC transporter ATP-binding protein [Murimonas intestini]MCR1839721.1 ABC transporter ATP-binding protein/permease [Murimonas intestini]MCR1866564.1 ABC transporter ATP-binding protein/permease [Murimonas intestini]MCR1884812.1 ABC transporter ATP-binding protein/permease [Murimonas intestini]
MLKMFRYVKDKWYAIIMIVALLFLQAYCDLSLPDYTSRIVNVGIQQKGVEDGVPEEIREETMQKLFLFMSDEEQKQVEEQYTVKDGIYTLNKIDKETRDELNSLFGVPMLAVSGMSEDNEETAKMKEQMHLPADADIFQVLMQMPKEQLSQMMSAMTEKMGDMPETIVTQAATSFVQKEYVEMGKDADKMQTDYIILTGLKMLGLALLGMLAAILVTFLSCRLAASMGRNLRNHVYSKVISFSGTELNHFSTASLITRSTNDIQQVQMLMTMLFRIILYAPIMGVGGVLKVVKTDSSMTWILGVGVLLIMALVGFLFAVAMPKFKILQTLIDKLNLVTREILTGIPVIRAFSTEKHEEERFEKANRDLTKTNLFVNRCMTFMMPAMMLIMNGITVLIVYNGAYAIDAGNMQVGNMMAFMQYAMQIIMSFLMITMLSIMLPRASVSAKRINEILETEVSIHDPSSSKKAEAGRIGEVEFDHVSFGYPGAEENVLSDINFTARKGQTVAFIGSTGSGKSTLVNLIPRFFDVTKGSIRVDGVDVRDMTLKDLRDKLGYVPQKGVLFSGTIDSNLRYGREEATEEEVKQAARIAQAWDFISEKQEGLQSPIAQGGTNVSGGQKQRLSIARAIAKKPEIYIFDDSFSALDYKTDVVLRRALKQETKDATTLIVAQRISTILHADNIIVLDEGHVAGQGTHKELLKNCDVYKQIAMSQLSEEELANE